MGVKPSVGITGGVVLAVLLWIIEKFAPLHLPSPSFKSVGPSRSYSVPTDAEGVFAPNTYLQKAERLFGVNGSESVGFSPDGYLYMLDRYGNVVRGKPGYHLQPEHVNHLGPGHPLGFRFSPKGDLYVCNCGTGLQVVEKGSGKIVLLSSRGPKSTTSHVAATVLYPDDLAIASDGGVYFSDSTDIPPTYSPKGFYDVMESFMLSLVQGDHTGRLLHVDTKGKTSCIADDLFFANGVELSQDESFVLVVETAAVRISRVWLKGPKAGTKDVFVDKLPGYPDGLRRGPDGSFWIAIVVARQPTLELLLYSRLTRWLLPRVPPSLKPLKPGSAVIQVSPEGKVLRYMADPQGSVIQSVTSVVETKEGLYFGNLHGNTISFLRRSNFSPILD